MSGLSPSSLWPSSGKQTSNKEWMPETPLPQGEQRQKKVKMVKRVEEMQGIDARKQTIAMYDSFIGAQVKVEQGCIVRPPQSWCNNASLFCLDLSSDERIIHNCCRLSCICTLHLLPCPSAVAVPYGRPSREVTHPSIIPVKWRLTLDFQRDKVV
ncbi:hypothetical protein R1flu_028204 [Riccia fluitans]|uniref:Uncharacterized protein n=1 Tax=Riccia fluitans TaxID=41844 RepID=A0ABD1XNV5_9MARC